MNYIYQSATPHIQLKDKGGKLRNMAKERDIKMKKKKDTECNKLSRKQGFKSDDMTLKSAKGIGF